MHVISQANYAGSFTSLLAYLSFALY